MSAPASIEAVPTIQADYSQLVALVNAGRYAELESLSRLLVERYPESGVVWRVLSVALQAQGKDALSALQKTKELLPDDADVHCNLGDAMKALGRLGDAVASYRRALEIKPDFAKAHCNLGVTLRVLGHLDDAAASYRRALEVKPDFAEMHCNLGNVLRDLGQLDGAVASHRRALAIKPDFADAHYNLGIILKELGQLEDAVESYRSALKLKPDYAEGHNNLGVALKVIGRLDDAVASYRRALEIKPDYADARYNLGNVLRDLGQLDDAVESYRRALEIKPDYTDALYNLGTVLRDLGQLDDAVESYRRALEIKPDYVDAHSNLGTALRDLGQLDDAVASYRRALEIKPDYAEAHCNLGIALRNIGQLDDAMASYRRALEVKPDFAEVHNNLGVALHDFGQFDAAVASYRRALEIKPDFAEAHSNLGNALRDLWQMDDAVASYRRALEIKPDFAKAHSNLGIVLHDLGQLDAAVASYRRAQEIEPKSLEYAIQAHLLLPIIPDAPDTLAAWRERYQTGIAALMDAPGVLENPGSVNPFSFYLAYDNCNDRPVMEALCRFFRGRMPGKAIASLNVTWSQPTTLGQRIRVGFLSELLAEHTVGKLYQGFIRHLDRGRFEVVVIHTPKAKRDSFSERLDEQADRPLTLPASLEGQQQAIMAEKLDVLFYPDIGMKLSTYFLAYSRLAPVQAVGWGHPDTTGLDSMDYFVSAASIEPEDADEHYTERLIRLNRMPCFYQAMAAPTRIPGRAVMGLPETGTLYGCPQSLFKFHPDFDGVLAAIAGGDPEGHIVLLEGKHAAWATQMKARWARTYPILLEKVVFLPRLPQGLFMALIAHMDVLLDPVHFGSGNTLYEAMVYGIPVVTWPGQFMRGRIVAGAYRQMGVVDAPIAQRLEDYAPLALALGRDQERRQALRQVLLEAAGRELFADMRAVREFEIFLEAAVAAAGRGEKLQSGWRPDIGAKQTMVKTTLGTELETHIYPEKSLFQKDAGVASQENLSPVLLAYHQNVLVMRQSSAIDYPAHVHLETMAKCNAACSFCPYSTLDRQGVMMEDALIEKVVNDLCDIPRSHNFQLSPLKVNEPFLDNRLIDLLALFNARLPNASITLTSNASPITEKKLAQLAAFPRLGYLWISFNDHREVEYEQTMQLPYKRTLERLEMIHKAKAEQRLHIRVVLSRVSDGSPVDREFAQWVKTRFPLFDVSLFPRGGWIGQVDGPANLPPAVGCSRWFDVSITATGVVAHCCMDGKAEFPIGNVRHEHVLEIYNKPDFRRLREKLNTRLEADPCRRCGFL